MIALFELPPWLPPGGSYPAKLGGTPPPNRAFSLLVFIMVRVIIGKYRPQDAHYGLYKDNLPSGDIIVIRRKVGEPTDYVHPNSRKVTLHRQNFALASKHYSHLTSIQKRELRYLTEEVSTIGGRSKSVNKVLQGRELFISKDIHSLDEKHVHIPSYLQICIQLTDQDLNPLAGEIALYYQINGDWGIIARRLLSESYWLFPIVPMKRPLYHPIGEAYGYYDPEDPETTYLTQKELMLYHYHKLMPRPTISSEILRPNGEGDLTEILRTYPFNYPYHWELVDEEVPDDDETYLWNSGYPGYETDLYTLQAPTPETYDIKQVTIHARLKAKGFYIYRLEPKLMLKTHDQIFWQASEELKNWWKDYSWSSDKNPATNEPWTSEELTDLQAGISLDCLYGFRRDASSHCTQLYAEVEYYAPL